MSDFPLSNALAHRQTIGLDRATSLGVAVPDNGTWTELAAATTHAAQAVTFVVQRITSSFGIAELSLGIGPAGSEVAIIDSVPYADYDVAVAAPLRLELPVAIPAGSRVSVRGVARAFAGKSYNAFAVLHGSNGAASAPRTRCERIGGTGLAIGNDSTLTAWTELTAATTAAYAGVVVASTPPNNYSTANALILLDVAVGASGSEIAIIDALPFQSLGGSDVLSPVTTGLIDVPISAGSRVSIRAQGKGNVVPTFDLHGLR